VEGLDSSYLIAEDAMSPNVDMNELHGGNNPSPYSLATLVSNSRQSGKSVPPYCLAVSPVTVEERPDQIKYSLASCALASLGAVR
jgi:hypothetical protein